MYKLIRKLKHLNPTERETSCYTTRRNRVIIFSNPSSFNSNALFAISAFMSSILWGAVFPFYQHTQE
jgi:hypothetical protein